MRELRSLMKSHEIDYVLSYTIKPCIWGALAADAEGVESASLVTGLGYSFIPRGVRQRIVGSISRRLWRRATDTNRVVIFQNPDDIDDFVAAGALADRSKSRLVNGSGVDMAHYAPAPLPPDARFLMISRLLGNKGVREYCGAAAKLLRGGIEARFSLAGYFDEGGDGIAPGELDQWQAMGIEYLGPLDDVRPALAECSVFVLPSYREGTPRTVLEAMATGRPVITADAPGCRETVVDGVNGLLVTPRHTDDLADAMCKLALDPRTRARMAEAGYHLCREKYEAAQVAVTTVQHLGLGRPRGAAAENALPLPALRGN
jgi:glycosyltransferase involved in cell wall biosynthesis